MIALYFIVVTSDLMQYIVYILQGICYLWLEEVVAFEK